MIHEIESYGSLCSTKVFTINGIEAEYEDFGDKYDSNPDNAEDGGCGEMVFEPNEPTKEILEKYYIDELEYWTIANKLQDMLSFGTCSACA